METILQHKNKSSHYGKVISVRGNVVDVWFENNSPSIYPVLYKDSLEVCSRKQPITIVYYN
jgi:hypothetical protein